MDQPAEEGLSARERIRRLMAAQPYAVLCTQSGSQPYGSLVAFAASDDLGSIVFATPTATRKYRLLTECPNVAVLVDSRSGSPEDLMGLEAVTATGRARVVDAGPELDLLAGLLVTRHPHLRSFVEAPSSALVRIDVVRYFHVCRFQEVRQWVPGDAS
jgi:nitroimidazol reductase NimA-like FMN-containing flavoprotein (pyridoxamine 5'-phosphate oxidase superfamily)